MRFYRPTWAEINLNNLAHNFRQVRRLLPAQVKIMVTVKADAYGHGLIPVSKRLVAEGVDFLGVASIDEGIILRRAGINVPVLILGLILKQDISPLFEYSLTPTVCDTAFAKALDAKARKTKVRLCVHLKIDTGMGRIGVLHEDAEGLIRNVAALTHIELTGLFTHFAFADMDKKFTEHQIKLFNRLVVHLAKTGIEVPFIHVANSMGVIDYRHSHFTMVRPGIVMYGLKPRKDISIPLKPVLGLKTKVIFVKKVPRGYGISYGHAYVTRKNTTIVTLPIGYGDGYPRNLSNQAPVLIKGTRFTVCGRICMDQMMVDVGTMPVEVGEEVVLIGRQKNKVITTEELAELSGTIPYEIVCGLGSRIPRIYTN